MEIDDVPLKMGLEAIIARLLHQPLAMDAGQIARDLENTCPRVTADHVKIILEFVRYYGYVVVVDSHVRLTRSGRERAKAHNKSRLFGTESGQYFNIN
jgi:hypothetical protein